MEPFRTSNVIERQRDTSSFPVFEPYEVVRFLCTYLNDFRTVLFEKKINVIFLGMATSKRYNYAYVGQGFQVKETHFVGKH